MNNIPIILLHGLGGPYGNMITRLSLYPLKKYLQYNNYNNVHIIPYLSSDLTIDESVEFVSNEISKITNKEQEIIVVGQSLGGVIAFKMHEKKHKIRLVILNRSSFKTELD